MMKNYCFEGSIIPYDDIEIDAMTKLKHQIIKSQA